MATFKNTVISTTGYIQLPTGTTLQRPNNPQNGFFRFNTDTNKLEVFIDVWLNLSSIPRGSEKNPAISATEILSENPSAETGFYYIQSPGMGKAQRIWCDMDADGGGFMRFWWHGKYEIDGSDPFYLPEGDKLAIADISTIDPDAQNGYGRVPSGVTPSEFMVKGTSPQVAKNGNQLEYAIWDWTVNNVTANNALSAFRDGQTINGTNGGRWLPYIDTTGQLPIDDDDYFWYNRNGTGSFNLDDDSAYANTVFGAGNQQSDSDYGTDFATNGDPEINEQDHLVLYWR